MKAERSVRPVGTVGRIASGLASSIDGSVVASDGATSSDTSLDSSCSGRRGGRDDARGLVNNRARGGRGQAFDGSGNTSAGLSIESLLASQPSRHDWHAKLELTEVASAAELLSAGAEAA